MAYKLAIPEHTEHQIDKCISYIVNTLRNPSAASAVLDDIEHAYDLLEETAESFAFCEDPYLQSKGYRKLTLEKHDYVVHLQSGWRNSISGRILSYDGKLPN